ncbi:hypothetical protein ACHWQZ_G011952 [Mnemiopsis leidyi]
MEAHQIVFGTIETAGLLIGGMINLLLLTFHVKQSNKSTTILLYCLMNGTDLLICILMIPIVISCWAGSKPLFFETVVAREIWLFLWEVSGRTSVFLIGLQSVLRTRALLFPFCRRIKKLVLIIIIISYLIILSSIQSVRFFYHVSSVFSANTNRPTMIMGDLQDAIGRKSIKTVVFLVANSFFGYVAPFLPITFSCLISVHCINKSGKKAKKCRQLTEGTDQNHQTATRTVVLLTVVYILTNALTFVIDLNEMMVSFTKIVNKRVYFIDWLKAQLNFFATIETAGILVGGVANFLLLAFHLKQTKKSTTILLYCFTNVTDLLICVLMIPTVISCWAGSKPLFFETVVAREIWLFLWEVSGRTSVFLIGLQSVLRTRALLFPFSKRLRKVWLAGIMITYAIILCSLQSVRFFYKVYSIFSPRTCRATLMFWWLQEAMGPQGKGTIVFMFMTALFGYVIPFLPITLSCVISIVCIKNSRKRTAAGGLGSHPSTVRRPTGASRPSDNHKAATKTIVILTVVYLLTNSPLFVMELNELMVSISIALKKQVNFINWEKFIEDGNFLYYVFIYVFSYNVCILLNSAVNAFVFLSRTAEKRKFVADTFMMVFRCGKKEIRIAPSGIGSTGPLGTQLSKT